MKCMTCRQVLLPAKTVNIGDLVEIEDGGSFKNPLAVVLKMSGSQFAIKIMLLTGRGRGELTECCAAHLRIVRGSIHIDRPGDLDDIYQF